MSTTAMDAAISCLRDSATDPEIWSAALPLITAALGAPGAACFVRNDQTGALEWVKMVGPASERKREYIDYYGDLDLYLPALSAPAQSGWLTLSECLPEPRLRQSEWYQDFVKPCGLADVLGIQLDLAGPRRVFFGVHYETVQQTPSPRDARMHLLLGHLQTAARLGQVQRAHNLRASLGSWAVGNFSDAVFVADDGGRIVEMNAAAERDLSLSRVVTVRHGRLEAVDPPEARRLAALIAAAGDPDAPDAGTRRMLVGGTDHRRLLTVDLLEPRRTPNGRALVVIRAVDLQAGAPPGAGLAELFGLSPAEDRLAQALVQGRTLQELTGEFNVRMPTLRAQIRSILRKCGVQRQVDLMRVLLRLS